MPDEATEIDPLLERLRGGEREALARLFAHYRPRLKQLLRLRLDGRVAARLDDSDVLQEAYLDAERLVAAYLRRPRVAFYVWLRGLVCERLANVHRDHLGAQRRAVRREQDLPADSSALLAGRLLAPGASPSHALLREELRQRVQEALDQLGADDREVIVLRHFEGLSNAEVAQVLGLGHSGATMRYGRALVRLKGILAPLLSAGEARP